MIILILLFIQFIFFTYKSPILSCGLFGWVGQHPSAFNKHSLSILGLYNQGRGTDSCGIYANGQATYGIAGKSKFDEFIQAIPSIKVGPEGIAMGHTRKASVGFAIVDNAQPIMLGEDGKAKIILTHNGTLYNYKELAEEANIDISDLNTDSQVLASLIAQSPKDQRFNILSKYVGSAALAIYFPEEESFYLFKGNSPSIQSGYYSSEERPLYYYIESKNSFYYSSMKEPLKAISQGRGKIKEVPENTVLNIKNGELIEIEKIDREKAGQKEAINTKVTSNVSRWNEHYSRNTILNYNNHRRSNCNIPNIPARNSQKVIKFTLKKSLTDIILPNEYLSEKRIKYLKGRYCLKTNPISGIFNITDDGYIKETNNANTNPIAFLVGIMLNSVSEYSKASKYYDLYKRDLSSDSCFRLLGSLSSHPITPSRIITTVSNRAMLWDIDKKEMEEYNGIFRPYFTSSNISMEKGLVTEIDPTPTTKHFHYKDIKLKVLY